MPLPHHFVWNSMVWVCFKETTISVEASTQGKKCLCEIQFLSTWNPEAVSQWKFYEICVHILFSVLQIFKQ